MAPSDGRHGVSYPVSDSLSRKRRAKQHGTETRADTPAAVGLYPFRHVRRPCSATSEIVAASMTREQIAEAQARALEWANL